MVMVLLILALTAGTSLAAEGSSASEPNLRRTHLPPISTITIRNSGTTSPVAGESKEECADFKLSYEEIHAYIGQAAEVAEHDFHHLLDWSPCHASGEVTFKNGLTGIWAIQRYRAGSLTLNDGRTLYLYCPRCQAKAFPSADK